MPDLFACTWLWHWFMFWICLPAMLINPTNLHLTQSPNFSWLLHQPSGCSRGIKLGKHHGNSGKTIKLGLSLVPNLICSPTLINHYVTPNPGCTSQLAHFLSQHVFDGDHAVQSSLYFSGQEGSCANKLLAGTTASRNSIYPLSLTNKPWRIMSRGSTFIFLPPSQHWPLRATPEHNEGNNPLTQCVSDKDFI